MKIFAYFAFTVFFMATLPAHASVMTVSSPNMEQGEFAVELGNGWQDGNPDTYEHELELGYSPLSFWKTEFEFGAEREAGDDLEYAETTWKNTLRFMKQDGQSPVAAAVRLDYSHVSLSGEPDEVTTWLLVQHKRESWAATLNAGLNKEVGNDAEGGLGGELRAKVVYDWCERIHPAIEYFGNFGYLSDNPGFDEQSHRIGPAVTFDVTEQMGLEVGYVAGLTDSSPDHSVKLNLEYEF